MGSLIRRGTAGLFPVALRPCTAQVLATFLPRSGAIVWIRGHRPEPIIRWWSATLPLSRRGTRITGLVRDVAFDLQLSVEDFLKALPEFEESGLDLYLMARPVPDTLTLRGVEAEAAQLIIIANGMMAHFDLPHAGEVAVLSSTSEAMLESWLHGALGEWALDGPTGRLTNR